MKRLAIFLPAALAVLAAGAGCGGDSKVKPDAGTFGDGPVQDLPGPLDMPGDYVPPKEKEPDVVPDGPTMCGVDVRVTNWSGGRGRPSLAWNGTVWGVAWEDYRDGNWEIYFTTLDKFGGRTSIGDNQISATAKPSNNSSLVWNGSKWAAVWNDDVSGNGDILFDLISTEGKGMGEVDTIKNDGKSQRPVLLARTGGGYAMAWENVAEGLNFEIYFALLDEGGTLVGPETRVSNATGNSFAPAIAKLGDGYVLAWYDERDGADKAQIYIIKIDKDGKAVGVEKKLTSEATPSHFPSVVVSDKQVAVAYEKGQELWVALLRAADLSFDIAPKAYSPKGEISAAPSIAYDGTNFGLAYQTTPMPSNSDIRFLVIDKAGATVGSEKAIADPKNSFSPSLAWSGSSWGIAWEDDRPGRKEIYFGCF